MSIGRLIVEFVANTGKFETDTARAAKTMERRAAQIEKAAISIGKKIAAAFAVREVFQIGKAAIDSIANLQDLAEKAGDSAEAFGSLSKASEVSGIALDTVAAASIKLTASLSKMDEDGGPAADAIKALGLNFAEFTKLSPVSQIDAVANALAKFEDDASKTAVAVALFGKSGAEILPFLNDLADGSERQITLTEKQIQAANAFQEQVGALRGEIALLTKEAIAGLIPQLSSMLTKIDESIKYFSKFGEESTLLSKVLRGIEIVFETLTILAANVAYVFSATGKEIGAIAAQMVALAKLDLTAFSAIGDAVKEDAARARAELDEFEKRILSVKVPVSVAEAAEKRPALKFTPGADAAAEKAAASAKKAAKATDEWSVSLQAASEIQDEVNLMQEESSALDEERARIFDSTRTAAEEYAETIKRLNFLFDNGTRDSETYNRAVAQAQDAFDKASKETEETTDEMSKFAERAAENMQDAFADFLFNPFDKGLKGMLASFADTLQRMAAQAAAAEIFNALGLGAAGKGINWGGVLGSILGMSSSGVVTRASGGPLAAGQMALVGERGPELFVPNTSGKITPNNKMGGDTINNYINIPITAPSGTVGRPTMDQISSAALAGAQRAQSRKR